MPTSMNRLRIASSRPCAARWALEAFDPADHAGPSAAPLRRATIIGAILGPPRQDGHRADDWTHLHRRRLDAGVAGDGLLPRCDVGGRVGRRAGCGCLLRRAEAS